MYGERQLKQLVIDAGFLKVKYLERQKLQQSSMKVMQSGSPILR